MHPAEQYAHDVVAGKVLACKWVKLACQRHLDDLQEAPDRGFFFDQEAGERVIRFFRLLRHSKGEWAGQVFDLSPWQQFVTWCLFGWKKKKDNTRRFRTAYIEVARKNGKSTWLAGLGLYLFAADDEPGAEVYSAATKREQARITHSEATRMVKSSPTLRKRIGIFRDNLHIEETASKFEPLGADSNTMDGLNVHACIVDELHAHRTRDVWDILETATGSRRQPLQLGITTSGFNKHSVCYEQHEYTKKILDHILEDDTYFGIIYTLDEGDDWQDDGVWEKANPNLNVSVKIDDLRRKAVQAKELPSKQNAFKRLHMNLWTQAETRWLSADRWQACGTPVNEEGLRGRPCYSGLDLSSNIDITALVHVFPPEVEGEPYKVVCRFWIPQDNMTKRVRRDRVPYDVWCRQGFIQATPGNVIDYKHILSQLDDDARKFDIKELAFDRWGATKVIQEIEEHGLTVVQFGQGFASMARPTKELEKLVLAGEIAHGNNPVLSWMADNVVVREDPAGNMKPDKDKSIEKIDGIVALIMGLDRATCMETHGSVYEERGIISL